MNTKNYKFLKTTTELQNTKHPCKFLVLFSLQFLQLQLIIEITFTKYNAAKNKNIKLYRDGHVCYMQIFINVM